MSSLCLPCDWIPGELLNKSGDWLEPRSSWLCAWAAENPLLKGASEMLLIHWNRSGSSLSLWGIFSDLFEKCFAVTIKCHAVHLLFQELWCIYWEPCLLRQRNSKNKQKEKRKNIFDFPLRCWLLVVLAQKQKPEQVKAWYFEIINRYIFCHAILKCHTNCTHYLYFFYGWL